jgi:hypothetical protein
LLQNELATYCKSKNIRDLRRVIDEFKTHYELRNNFVRMRMVIYLQILRTISIGRRITSLATDVRQI